MKKALLATLAASTMLLSADYVNSIGMRFKEIPAGSFVMGTKTPNCPIDNPFTEENEYEKCATNIINKNETPAHTVSVKSFYMAETEVTQGQWYEIMGDNPSKFKTGDANMPVETVSLHDAKEFVRRLNNKENTAKYTLPTEAQWEYAVRAGTTTKWYCGDNESCVDSIAVYDANSPKSPKPVKSKKPNKWGLYDMSGNVDEWVEDCWSENYNSAPTNAETPSTKNCIHNSRSHRGGSYLDNNADSVRSANRNDSYSYSPRYRYSNLGLRLVRTK